MELYNRCKNIFYDYTLDLINSKNNKTEELIQKYFDKNINTNTNTNKKTSDAILTQIYEIEEYISTYLSNIEDKIPVIFTKIEKEYIKAMLKNEESSLFINDELHRKLEERLADSEDIDIGADNVYIRNGRVKYNNKNKKTVSENLNLLREAIIEEKKIEYENHTKHGVISGIVTPYKIMYSLRTGKLQLIAKSDRLLLLNIDRMSNIKILEENGADEIIEDSIVSHDAENKTGREKNMIINIEETANAHERAFMMFSHLEKSASYDYTTKTYEIKIKYYEFDEEDIIKDILSLGQYAEIIEPEDLRRRIKQKVQEACSLYESN